MNFISILILPIIIINQTLFFIVFALDFVELVEVIVVILYHFDHFVVDAN
jgi:hypothetical protein